LKEAFDIARGAGPKEGVKILEHKIQSIEAKVLDQKTNTYKMGAYTSKLLAVLKAKKRFLAKFWIVSVICADGTEVYQARMQGRDIVAEVKDQLARSVGVPTYQQLLFLLEADSGEPVRDTIRISEAGAAANVAPGGKIQFFLQATSAGAVGLWQQQTTNNKSPLSDSVRP
jgi:hypothetical protein